MTEAVIVAAARTPIGRARKGSLVDVDAFRLARDRGRRGRRAARASTPPTSTTSCSASRSRAAATSPATSRCASASPTSPAWPTTATAPRAWARCRSPPAASGPAWTSVVIAGGTESLSTSPQTWKVLEPGGEPQMWMSPSHPETPDAPAFDMSITVGENTAREMGLTRLDVDEWAALQPRPARSRPSTPGRSRRRSCRSSTPTATATRARSTSTSTRGAAPPSRRSPRSSRCTPRSTAPTVTAGNAAGPQRRRRRAGASPATTTPRPTGCARWPASCRGRRSASSPARTGLGPTLAIPKALDRAGLTLDDIDLFEINEAFCSVPVAAVRTLGIDPTIVNVNGSGCSLGHPIAATGARMVVTMIHELRRRGADPRRRRRCAPAAAWVRRSCVEVA